MSKKEKKKWSNFGSIPISIEEAEWAGEHAAKQSGIILALQTISEQLGNSQVKWDKFWRRLRKKYDFPYDDGKEFHVYLDHHQESIIWRRRFFKDE